MDEKLDIKQLLEDLGFTVSLDYEREPMGVAFAEVHDHLFLFNGSMSTYQSVTGVEIQLMIIITDQTETMLRKAVTALRDDYTLYRNEASDNSLTLTFRGGLAL